MAPGAAIPDHGIMHVRMIAASKPYRCIRCFDRLLKATDIGFVVLRCLLSMSQLSDIEDVDPEIVSSGGMASSDGRR